MSAAQQVRSHEQASVHGKEHPHGERARGEEGSCQPQRAPWRSNIRRSLSLRQSLSRQTCMARMNEVDSLFSKLLMLVKYTGCVRDHHEVRATPLLSPGVHPSASQGIWRSNRIKTMIALWGALWRFSRLLGSRCTRRADLQGSRSRSAQLEEALHHALRRNTRGTQPVIGVRQDRR